ncbi:MAG: hypothetical protein JXR91_17900 [Deltaproteobacteria bacterium]|nr:hypothetical protein [Deltaproteobacteria bacterium]
MIWPFKNRQKIETAVTPDVPKYDLHNHIIFDVDDGADDIEESILMIEGFIKLGYKGLYSTSHHNHYAFDTPSVELINSRQRIINEILLQKGLEIEIKNGAEIMLREDYSTFFKNDTFPQTGAAYLVEFPHQQSMVTELFKNFIFDCAKKGKVLLIAHPERNPDFQRKMDLLYEFKELGVLLQIDIMSLIGRYGALAKKTGWTLIENNFADIVSSDLHKGDQIQYLNEALNELAAYDEETFIKLTSTNPGYIFRDEIDRLV